MTTPNEADGRRAIESLWSDDWTQAPRDGSEVLLRLHNGGIHIGRWSTSYSVFGLGGCWTDGFGTMGDKIDYSHWAPGDKLREALWLYGKALRSSPAVDGVGEPGQFQDRVADAHIALFHDDPTDVAERRDRFYEEATETVQALGMTEDDAHKLVAYTFSRPPGYVRKEIGAAALTLASLCVTGGWDMMECAEADLAALRTPEKIAKVRAKRATRHGRGPLPGNDPALSPTSDRASVVEEIAAERRRQVEVKGWSSEHDDEHTDGSLALAAVCYATPTKLYQEVRVYAGGPAFFDPWPNSWHDQYDKRYRCGERKANPGNSVPDPATYTAEERRDLLVKAAALLVAEIERLDRAALSPRSS